MSMKWSHLGWEWNNFNESKEPGREKSLEHHWRHRTVASMWRILGFRRFWEDRLSWYIWTYIRLLPTFEWQEQNSICLYSSSFLSCGGLRPQAPPPPPAATDENKSTKTWSAWGGKVADLSKEKGWEPLPQWAFIGFNLHRNTGKAHRSLSGSKDQTIEYPQMHSPSLSLCPVRGTVSQERK